MTRLQSANKDTEKLTREALKKAQALHWLKTFNGVVWHYEGGYAAVLEIIDAPNGTSEGQPEGIQYCFTFHEPGVGGEKIGNRIYGLDNSHSPDKDNPWDHEHKTVWPKEPPGARPRESKGQRFTEASIEKAFELFPKNVEAILERLGLGKQAIRESRLPPKTAEVDVDANEVDSRKPKKGARK